MSVLLKHEDEGEEEEAEDREEGEEDEVLKGL